MGNHKKKSQVNESRKRSSCIGDVTLNDFANVAISGKTRIRKQASKLISKNEDDADEVMDGEADGDPTNISTKQRRKKKISETEETGTNVYPLDIWSTLARYIKPEDVGRFAGICSGANQAVNSASFWFHLYKRYYTKVKDMPERLLPESMTRLHGLKSCVIRSLYYTYPPLASKYFLDTSTNKSLSEFPVGKIFLSPEHVKKLMSRKCTLAWSQQEDEWKYTFNFILARQIPVSRSKNRNTIPDLLSTLGNIYANDAENCLMLQVVSREFKNTPTVLGLSIIHLAYDQEKLTVTFSSNNNSRYDDEKVEFKFVERVRIHNWWSPYYPHSNTLISNTINEE